MMKTSCGVLLIGDNKLLMCHVTLSNPSRWDIPKGELDPGEDPVKCALRELYEETGTTVFNLKDLGIFHYLPHKALHLYHSTQESSSVAGMKCSSYFTMHDNNYPYPEVDEFMFVPFDEVDKYASKALFTTLSQALQLWRG
jgi:8-oxo-dGTP pyrophosphatase MutT (NUDIX family)